MKHLSNFKSWAMTVAALCLALFTSCEKGSDEPGDSDDPTKQYELKAVIVNYSVDISQDFMDFFDFTVIHGLDETEGVRENITANSWSFTARYGDEMTVIPERVFCKVIATPKSVLPTIDPDKTYNFTSDHVMSVNRVRNNDQTSLLTTSGNGYKFPIRGNKLEEYLAKGERTIVDFSCTIKSE